MDNSDRKETPVWRIVLSVLLAIFMVVRLIIAFSKAGSTNSSAVVPDNEAVRRNMEQTQSLIENGLNKRSNNILYTEYQTLDKFPQAEKDLYKISKIENDTMIGFDLSSKIRIKKGYYFQNNHDDTLRMAIKTPKDLNIFVHDLTGKGELSENFKSIKKDGELQDFKFGESTKAAKIITYSLTKNNSKFNGYALAIQDTDYTVFIEFESTKMQKSELKTQAALFLLENLKINK